jgi:NADPH:quinone reductase-like Zn-dependent oxidoreductase
MKAVMFETFGGPEVLQVVAVPDIQPPGPTQLLVRVMATSVNPLDIQKRRGDYPEAVPLPAVIGSDVSGVVSAVGEAIHSFRPGDEVYYTPPLFAPGGYAEYHVIEENVVARKPVGMSHTESAALPLAGGTAWEALFERAALLPGETVLVHAAAGGVGSLAVQLAKAAGAVVLATCGGGNVEFVRSLGADHVFDYRTCDFVRAVFDANEEVDVVLDTVGGETLARSIEVIRPGGRMVSIVDTPYKFSLLPAYERNLTLHLMFTTLNGNRLDRIRGMVERQSIRPVVHAVLPISQAGDAHRLVEAGGIRGKVVLDLSEW